MGDWLLSTVELFYKTIFLRKSENRIKHALIFCSLSIFGTVLQLEFQFHFALKNKIGY